MPSPAVSICIPAYKAERYLRETLDSAKAQTFTDWEMIVTEDGSRDGTEQIVNDFAKGVSQRVVYHRHDPNRGLPATRNHGISTATAPWIALLDSDDLWLPTHLEDLMSRAAQGGVDLVHAGSRLFDSDTGKDLELRVPSAEDIATFPTSLYDGSYIIQPSSVLLSRDLWKKVGGFNPEFRYVEDREMWLRCARALGRFAYTGNVTMRYRKHASALSKHAAPMALALAQVCEQHVDWTGLPKTLRHQKTVGAWTAAGRISLREQPKAAARYFAKALRYSRLNPRLWAYWATATVLGWSKPSSTK
ncbi:MAG TPA: glycosyltransferase [Opitutaceae bacterium]|nr:glycosyltransferase [Opitutaceae bacterium]